MVHAVRRPALALVALAGCFSPTDLEGNGPSDGGTGSSAGPDTGADDIAEATNPDDTADETGCTPECDVTVCNGDMLDQCVDDGTGCNVISPLPCEMGCVDDACVGPPPELAISIVSAVFVETELQVTYVVANFGEGPSGPFRVDLWYDRPSGFASPPALGEVGDLGVVKESLEAGGAMQYTDAIPAAPQGDHVAFAMLDTEGTLPEGNRGNNVSLGFAWTTTPDTVHTSFGVPSAPIYLPPDGTPVESVLTVDIGGAVPSDFWVTLNMTHPEIMDLQIDVIAPDGTTTPIVLGSPSGADLGGSTFRTGAATAFADGTPPFVGEYTPAQAWPAAVAVYDGDWTLRVTDLVPDNGNDGEVNDWSVSLHAP